MAVLEECMRLAWGPEAVNEKKKDEEGSFRTIQLLWGLYMDFQNGTVGLPESKCMKGHWSPFRQPRAVR